MTLREQLIEDLKRIPEEDLERVRQYLDSLIQPINATQDKVWQAYLQSEQQREEVYRRLANS